MTHFLRIDDYVASGQLPHYGRITGFKTDISNGRRVAVVLVESRQSEPDQEYTVPVSELRCANIHHSMHLAGSNHG
jgi:hypothetical protein